MRAHHVIETIHIEGGSFFPDLRLELDSALNCIFGGTGVGKSGVLLAIRYALGTPAAPPYAKLYDAYIRDTLGGGEITVGVRTQHGVRYTCKRRYGDEPRVYDDRGNVVHVSLDGELFKIDAYGQGTLEGIARSPEAQLALLDKFAEEDTRRIALSIANVVRDLTQNSAELRRLEGEIEAEGASVADLPSVSEAIHALAIVGGADAAETVRANARKIARARERVAMKEIATALAGAQTGLDAFARGAAQRIAAAVDGAVESAERGDHFRRAHGAARTAAAAVEEGSAKIRDALAVATTVIADMARDLADTHTKEDDAYQALARRDDADRQHAAERERLHRRFEALSAAAKRVDDRRVEQAATKGARVALLSALESLHRELYAIRVRIAAEVTAALSGTIRVRVDRSANVTAYLALLTELLHGSNLRVEFIGDIAANIRPADLVALVEADDPAPIESADGSRTGKSARAQKILAALRASARLGELEIVPVADTPCIELKVGERYLPSNKVSDGQRCICILPIILLQSAAPLLIDQAEDHIDGAYINHVLVKSVALAKRDRQLIIVTHNANVPVLADAERSFLLSADDGVGVVARSGTVDEMHTWMEAMLDGGSEAFLQRSKRYGYRLER
jgi:hypothetical protein